jgi:ABC-type multidrug transport system fused ATPase/permease subunit
MDYDFLFRNVQGLTPFDIEDCASHVGKFRRKSEREKASNAIREIYSYGPQEILESMVETLLGVLKNGDVLDKEKVELALRDLRLKDFTLKKSLHDISLQTDCVDTTRFYYPRSKLLNELEELLTTQQYAFLISPSGTGKSTLIQLFME